MKFRTFLLVFLGFALFLGFSSCEGDEGPVGPAGPTGETGEQGLPGEQGWGTQDCAKCHSNSQLITAKVFQWEHSGHATGGHYDRNTTSCAVCHTSQGFLERIATGGQTTAEDIKDPLPQNCYTCHKIHQTYTEADWASTVTEPVTLWLTGDIIDVGKGNLCVSCHQARIPSPALPDPATGGTVTITNSRYGPHHGAQGMMFNGKGGYEVGTGYSNSAHTQFVENACVTCHMATAKAAVAGGHTFNVSTGEEFADINTAACVACHTNLGELETTVDDVRADIDNLVVELETKLVDRGLLNPTTKLAIPNQDFEGHEAGALWNYQYVQEDKSRGIHNYKYAKKLLENSIAALQ
ncbi:MAG: hypothetical protein R2830_03985 [Saprospiraceae bacterium]